MAKFPSLPLYTDAFIADTVHLNAAQTGAYLMLLMAAWRTSDCRLPDDDKILARFSRMDLRSWNANKDVIMSFWKKDDQQKWYQARLVDERKHADDVRSKNVAAGKASALKRHETSPTLVQPNVNVNSTNPTLPYPTLKKDIDNPDFDEFWKLYPKARAGCKKKAFAKFQEKVSQHGVEKILTGVKAYAISDEVEKGFAKGCAAWLNDDRFLSVYVASPKKQSQSAADDRMKLQRELMGV